MSLQKLATDCERKSHQRMMIQGKSVSVRITSEHQEKFTDGFVRVQFWERKQRILRALKFGAICWGMALVSIVLPLAHFVLVPGFFLAGPLAALWAWGQESVVLGGEGTCPICGAYLPIVRSPYRFPLSDLCSSCRQNIKIEPHVLTSE